MGADCIISGIRPQIEQTMVHLQIDLSAVATKATMADALRFALKRMKEAFPNYSSLHRRKDLPNLRASSVAHILRALMTACPGHRSPPDAISVEIFDGWVYPHHNIADRKVRLFLVIRLNSC